MKRHSFTESYWKCPACDISIFVVIHTVAYRPLFGQRRLRVLSDGWQDRVVEHALDHVRSGEDF